MPNILKTMLLMVSLISAYLQWKKMQTKSLHNVDKLDVSHFLKMVISIFCFSVPMGNINEWFPHIPVIIQWDFWINTKSYNRWYSLHRALISTILGQCGITRRDRSNWGGLNPYNNCSNISKNNLPALTILKTAKVYVGEPSKSATQLT